MIIEDQVKRRVGWVGGIEKLEELNELAASMAVLDQRVDRERSLRWPGLPSMQLDVTGHEWTCREALLPCCLSERREFSPNPVRGAGQKKVFGGAALKSAGTRRA
jgi:hypothetical protein